MSNRFVFIGLAVVVFVIAITLNFISDGSQLGGQSNTNQPNYFGQEAANVGLSQTTIYWSEGTSLYRLNPETNQAQLVKTLDFEPLLVKWSPADNGSLAIKANGGQQWYYIPYGNERDRALNERISSPTWSGAGDRILYAFLGSDGGYTLTSSEPTTANFQPLFTLEQLPSSLIWPGSGTYALAYDRQGRIPIYLRLLISSQAFEPVAEGYLDGGGMKANPTGNLVLVDTGNSDAPQVTVVNLTTGETQTLNISTTVALAAWINDSELIFTDPVEQNIYTYKLETESQLEPVRLPIEPTELIGVISNTLFFTEGNQLGRISLE